MAKYLLAHDIGTSGNKATLFTVDGDMVESSTHPYETNYFNDSWAEQNPDDWWNAVCSSTKQLIKNIDPGDIVSISFSGQMMGCLCVDRHGMPHRNSIIYCDQRAQKQSEELLKKISLEELYRICGHRLSSVYALEKLMWVRDMHPEIYKETYKMLNAKDYIVFKLTGEYATDHSDASGTNAYDINKKEWSEEILDFSSIAPEKLPAIHESTFVAGEVTKDAAEKTGLKSGTPVVIGAGDGSAAAVGVGCIKPGSAYTYLGSSAWVGTATEEPFLDEKMRTMTWAHAIPDLYHSTGSMQAAGTCYQWLKNEICQTETKESNDLNKSPYEIINEKIEQTAAGSNGIIFLPYLLGERSPHWNPNAKGAFVGIKLTNKREDLLRSVLEGVTFNLNLIVDIFKSGIKIEEVAF
ncbi:MAG: FGGY-family carbohydrate kinase, partial [Bacteroidales bacterium]|nr:FGGY-family carbohydrate kinase [Bacteroidales bacterium]